MTNRYSAWNEYGLLHTTRHLLKRKRWDKLHWLLRDVDFIDEKVRKAGVDELQHDFGVVLPAWLGDGVSKSELETINSVLQREAHNLREETAKVLPGFTLQQLRNRCLVQGYSDFQQAVEAKLIEGGLSYLKVRHKTKREHSGDLGLIRTMTGHTGAITGIAACPDSRHAYSVDSDEKIVLWDLDVGEIIRTFADPPSAAPIAVTADGKYLISAGARERHHTLYLRDPDTGKVVHELEGHVEFVRDIVVAPDSKVAVSASWDHTLVIWDLIKAAKTLTLEGHTGAVNSVALAENGRHVVSGSEDRTIKIWDALTGSLVGTIEGTGGRVACVAVTPDSRLVVALIEEVDGSFLHRDVRVWDFHTHELITGYQSGTRGRPTKVVITPDSRNILGAWVDEFIQLFDLSKEFTGTASRWFIGHNDFVIALAMTPDGKYLLSGSNDKTLMLWDWRKGEERGWGDSRPGSGFPSNDMIITPADRFVVFADFPQVWDLELGKEVMMLPTGGAGWTTCLGMCQPFETTWLRI